MLKISYLLILLVICMLEMFHSRKTPAGRTPLGVSRSTSTKKPQLLAGPTTHPNPRAEQLEMAKEKLRKKISYQTKKQQEEEVGGEPKAPKKTKIPRPEKIRKDTSISDKSAIKTTATIDIQEESFELETVEQEVLRSKGVNKIPRTPLLLSLLAKRRKLQTKNDDEE